MNITRIDSSISYADASPSELIHNSSEKYICAGMVTFFDVQREHLKFIRQFKETRGIERKLKNQAYIVDSISKGLVKPEGLIMWNYVEVALENARHFLVGESLIEVGAKNSDMIQIKGHEISVGHLTSLTWYSIIIAVFLKQIGVISKYQNKAKAALFLDLLPGDDINKRRNLDIVTFLFDNTYLNEFRQDALGDNKLAQIGFGYGIKNNSTQELKNDFEFALTDWIIQSFHSLIKYEKNKLTKESNEFLLSQLAYYLLENNLVKLKNPIKLI
jgi:hypothetical protein